MVIDEKSEDRWRCLWRFSVRMKPSGSLKVSSSHSRISYPNLQESLSRYWWYLSRNYNMTSSSGVFVVMLQKNCWDNSLQSEGQNDMWEHSPSLFLFSLVSVEIAFLSSTNSTRSVQPLESSSFGKLILQAFCQSANAWGNGCSCFYICVLAGLKLWGFWVCKTHKY